MAKGPGRTEGRTEGGRYDVLVVGAGTAGTYLAWRLAEQGYSVMVVERDARPDIGRRLNIFHLDSIRFAQFGVPEPDPDSDELLAVYSDGRAVSPDGRRAKLAEYGFHVMRLPLFLKRLHSLAEGAGAFIVDGCAVREPLIEGGSVVGVRAEKGGEGVEYRARLTVDASGTAAVLRTALPPSLGVETFRLGPEDVLYVVLRYIRWAHPRALRPRGLNLWPLHKVFCNPGYSDEEAILGVGQPGSYDRAEQALEEASAREREVVRDLEASDRSAAAGARAQGIRGIAEEARRLARQEVPRIAAGLPAEAGAKADRPVEELAQAGRRLEEAAGRVPAGADLSPAGIEPTFKV